MADQELRSLRILVVDDEKFMRQLLVRLLDEIGFSVVEVAEDGHDAITKISRPDVTFDVVICDLSMPKMGGLEFVSALRAMDDPAVRDVPVIILTGHSQKSHVLAAARLGVSGFLVKPVSRQILDTRIRKAVERQPADPDRATDGAERSA